VSTAAALRIGDVARTVGTTPRTIRYYEEIGLLPETGTRASGAHRLYSEADVERLREIMRLRDGLGVTLDELKRLVEAQDARAVLREEWQHGHPDSARRLAIVEEALGHIAVQLDLVRHRRRELDRLEAELTTKRRALQARRRELS
jgi:DNA-binding transcriptional MerR regulator